MGELQTARSVMSCNCESAVPADTCRQVTLKMFGSVGASHRRFKNLQTAERI